MGSFQLIPLAISIICFSSIVHLTQGVKCYQCAYIEGVTNRDMNINCVSNVKATSVHSEEGVACLTAKGEIGGKPFVVRRAFLPGGQPRDFPYRQKSLRCDDERVANFGVATVTSVSDRRVDKLSSCVLCNERDNCNAAIRLDGFGLHLIFTITATLLFYLNF